MTLQVELITPVFAVADPLTKSLITRALIPSKAAPLLEAYRYYVHDQQGIRCGTAVGWRPRRLLKPGFFPRTKLTAIPPAEVRPGFFVCCYTSFAPSTVQ